MPELTLIIGNKNYSSWSLRPWILLKHLGLEFTEQQIPLDQADSAARIRAVNPAGRVPVLRHGELVIWESIAIGEYLCELAGKGLPPERAARARARSVSAEMHSGFHSLRTQWPMNARALGRRTAVSAALQGDITRIEHIWCECRERYGAGGPWLFGDYSLADAMYAPVVLRFRTYTAPLSGAAQHYMDTVLADAALQGWLAEAAAEPWIIAGDEAGA
ncbi:MAG: glutathione S-transferase family protein [Steroidobacteraceae bacterium]